jgi:hypothetical protein
MFADGRIDSEWWQSFGDLVLTFLPKQHGGVLAGGRFLVDPAISASCGCFHFILRGIDRPELIEQHPPPSDPIQLDARVVGMVEPPPHSESHLVVSLQAINGS